MNKCVKKQYSCGSRTGLWSNDRMPEKVGVPKKIFAYESDCDTSRKYHLMYAMRCSARSHDFIYRHGGTNNCAYSFCGMKV